MGRNYAGVLGCLAAVVAAVRGLRVGAESNSILLAMAASVGLFAAIGFVVGEIAAATVAESVRQRLYQAMAERPNAGTPKVG